MWLSYCAAYGAGCILAPWLCVYLGERAWDVLAFGEFMMAAFLFGRRFGQGKPHDWKAKIRGDRQASCSNTPERTQGSNSGGTASSVTEAHMPRRVLRAGISFLFFVEATETSVAAWCFTFALKDLGYSASQAALVPSTFYMCFTGTRLLLAPITKSFLPSAVVQIGSMIAFIGACLFYAVSSALLRLLEAGSTVEDLSETWLYVLIGCASLMGIGFSPQFPMVQAAMRQHGEMTPQEQGFLFTAASLGTLAGLWIPGLVSLPLVDLIGGCCVVAVCTSYSRDFPLRGSRQKQPIEAGVA